MEYVDGMNLRQLIQGQKIEPRQALELVMQICTALQFAHDEQIVHRDIKPENILITKKGQVKIADFGLAKLLGARPEVSLTASQVTMGTMNYMAPEQRENTKDVDHRADIYSLGVVFYEMLTGEVPMGRFDPPSKKVRMDVRLDEVVLHALEREPARRYQHVSEVKTGVESISSSMPGENAASATSEAFKSQRLPRLVAYFLKPSRLWVFACLTGVLTGLVPNWGFTTRYWGVVATDEPNAPDEVRMVASDSPAEQTGFRVGDVVIEPANYASFSQSWDRVKKGEKQTFTVRRGGQDVVLEASPAPDQLAVVWYANLWYPIAGALFLCIGIMVFATASLAPPPLWRSLSVAIIGLGIAIGFAVAVTGDGVIPRFAVYERWIFVPPRNEWWGLQGLFGMAAAILVTILGAAEIRKRLERPSATFGSPAAPASELAEKRAGYPPPPPRPEAAKPAISSPPQPRLSRAALAGAIWAPWFFLAALGFLAVEIRRIPLGSVQSGPAWWQVALMIVLFLPGLTAPFGATILGCVALTQIRRSAGRLYGLGLALSDALLFPLLFVDYVVIAAVSVIVPVLVNWLAGSPGPHSDYTNFATAVALLASAALDFFVVRKVWRSVRRTREI